jgi:hypothetical protein
VAISIFSKPYEIASVVSLPRNDKTTGLVGKKERGDGLRCLANITKPMTITLDETGDVIGRRR